jgi:type II secretion system protein N
MRLPRIPRRRKGTLQTPPKRSGGRVKIILVGLGLLLVSFMVGVYLFFPARALKERIEREVTSRTPVALQIERLSLAFPPGLEGRGITVTTERPPLKPIGISTLQVQPLWTSLFSGNPGLALSAHLLGGTLGGTMRRDGALTTQMHRIAFSEPVLPKSSVNLSGVLTEGSFDGTLPPRANTRTRLNLSLSRVRLTGLKPFGVSGGALDLGNVILEGEGKGNAFRIDKFETRGDGLQISGGGTLLVLNPLDRSRLNLNVVLRTGRNFDKSLTELLQLVVKPGRDGAYHLRLTGSLGRPRVR